MQRWTRSFPGAKNLPDPQRSRERIRTSDEAILINGQWPIPLCSHPSLSPFVSANPGMFTISWMRQDLSEAAAPGTEVSSSPKAHLAFPPRKLLLNFQVTFRWHLSEVKTSFLYPLPGRVNRAIFRMPTTLRRFCSSIFSVEVDFSFFLRLSVGSLPPPGPQLFLRHGRCVALTWIRISALTESPTTQ